MAGLCSWYAHGAEFGGLEPPHLLKKYGNCGKVMHPESAFPRPAGRDQLGG